MDNVYTFHEIDEYSTSNSIHQLGNLIVDLDDFIDNIYFEKDLGYPSLFYMIQKKYKFYYILAENHLIAVAYTLYTFDNLETNLYLQMITVNKKYRGYYIGFKLLDFIILQNFKNASDIPNWFYLYSYTNLIDYYKKWHIPDYQKGNNLYYNKSSLMKYVYDISI